MTTYYIWQTGPNGNGTSEIDSRRTIPVFGANDSLLFKCGETFSATNQVSITQSGTYWGAWGNLNDGMPIFTSTAANFGTINVQNGGLTTFENIHFLNSLNQSLNGALINCSVSGGRASQIKVNNCWFQGTGYNCLRLNGTNTASAAVKFECYNSVFQDIGEDAVFGCALDFRFGNNLVLSVSTRTDTGDCIGMINGDPNFVHIYNNYLDHSLVDSKQVIIVDTSGAATGMCIIEGNTLVGYGSSSVVPVIHTLVICEMPSNILRNVFYAYGLACGTQHPGDVIAGNIFFQGNQQASNTLVALGASDGYVCQNTFIGASGLPATTRCVVMADFDPNLNPVTSGTVTSNIFINTPVAIKSDSPGFNPVATNNCFWQVTSQRLDSNGAAFSGGADVTGNPLLRSDWMPMNPVLRNGGLARKGCDFYGKSWHSSPSIGAVQYQEKLQLSARVAKTV